MKFFAFTDFLRLLSFAGINILITLFFSAIALEGSINPTQALPKVSSSNSLSKCG